MDGFLIVQRGEDIGRRFDLDTTQLTIGRGADNDLVLNDPMVSRYHAVLKRQGSRYSLTDLGSSNPVVVNDQALEPGTPQQLTHRDVVFIGKTVFSFQHRAAGMGAAPAAQPATQQPARSTHNDTAATQMIGQRDFDPPTPPPPSRTAAPSISDTGERTVVASSPVSSPPPPAPAPSPMNDASDKTMVVGREEPTALPPLFAPPPPPAPVKFDDEETSVGMKPPMQGDRLVGTPPNEDDGDFPTQIIPRR